MKLFYLTCGRDHVNFDLFVHADTPSEAGKLYTDYFKLDATWTPRMLKAYDLSQSALCPSVMGWEHIPCTVVR